MAHDFGRRQRRDEQQIEQLRDRQQDREDEHDQAEERLLVAQQDANRRNQRMLGRPKREGRELQDRHRDAERQADACGEDRQGEEEPPAAQSHRSSQLKKLVC